MEGGELLRDLRVQRKIWVTLFVTVGLLALIWRTALFACITYSENHKDREIPVIVITEESAEPAETGQTAPPEPAA